MSDVLAVATTVNELDSITQYGRCDRGKEPGKNTVR